MDVEIWINAHQCDFAHGDARRLSEPEVLDRARERLPGWLAWELDAPEDEDRTATIAAALDADADLAAALAPQALDPNRIGIVLTDALRERVRTAAPASWSTAKGESTSPRPSAPDSSLRSDNTRGRPPRRLRARSR